MARPYSYRLDDDELRDDYARPADMDFTLAELEGEDAPADMDFSLAEVDAANGVVPPEDDAFDVESLIGNPDDLDFMSTPGPSRPAPVATAPAANPQTAQLAKLRAELGGDNSKAGDEGFGDAQRASQSMQSGSRMWLRMLANIFDPKNAAARNAEGERMAQQPIQQWQAGRAQANQRAQQGQQRNALAAQQQSQLQQQAARDRAMRLREELADPNSEINVNKAAIARSEQDRSRELEAAENDRRAARDAGMSLEQWRAHQPDLDRRARIMANTQVAADDRRERMQIEREARELARRRAEDERRQAIPGLEHDPSIQLPDAEVGKVRDTLERTTKIGNEAANVLRTFEEIGGVEALAGNVDMLQSDRVASADASTAELQNMARELANFGTPTGGELAIAARRLPSVTSATHRGTLVAKYQAFQRLAEQTRREVERLRGYAPAPQRRPPAPPTPPPGSRRISNDDIDEVLP